MHDIRALRENPEFYDAAWARRGLSAQTPAILAIDAELRAIKAKRMDAEALRNSASKAIGAAKAQKNEAEAERLMAEVAMAKTDIEDASALEDGLQTRLDEILQTLPNLPHQDVPEGKDEHDNQEVLKWGTPRKFDFAPKEHTDLGAGVTENGFKGMDFETAARISGARFVLLRGQIARLERALGQFMVDTHVDKNGYTEASGPVLVKRNAMFGTGQLPKFEDDLFKINTLGVEINRELDQFESRFNEYKEVMAPISNKIQHLIHELNNGTEGYQIKESFLSELSNISEKVGLVYGSDDRKLSELGEKISRYNSVGKSNEFGGEKTFYLIPTAEVSMTNTVFGDIIDDDQLPIRLTSLSPCFRSEAGSAGRDTTGMIRQHQFWKTELVSIARPEDSEAEHERMTACAEGILKALELPYRKILLCTGDMGFGAIKTYDLEVWLPGQNQYREISSCSNCGDFQARRMNTRTRKKGDKETRFVHTLNGSGLAVGRTLIAVLENYQNADGSVTIPEVLRKYMNGADKIK